MSEPGWLQLTRPVPDASVCSHSNPSALRPVPAPSPPPPPGAAIVATVPAAVTVTGRTVLVFAAGVPLEEACAPDESLPPVEADGAARTPLNVAAPDVVPLELAAPGRAIIEIWGA